MASRLVTIMMQAHMMLSVHAVTPRSSDCGRESECERHEENSMLQTLGPEDRSRSALADRAIPLAQAEDMMRSQNKMLGFVVTDEEAAADPPFQCYQSNMVSNIEYKILRNLRTEERVKVAVNLGGSVDELCLLGVSGKAPCLSVLQTVSNLSTSCEHNRNQLLLPFANRIANGTYNSYGTTHYLPRIADDGANAIQGFLHGKKMNVAEQTANADSASLTLMYTFDGSEPGYPFILSISVTYTLSDIGLAISVTASNPDQEGWPLPYYVGWHPYFAGENHIENISVEFDRCAEWGHLVVDEVNIPTGQVVPGEVPTMPIGQTDYDDGYKAVATDQCGPKLCTCIKDLYPGESTVVRQPASNQFVQVFNGGKNWGWQAVAVEPMSGATNAFNSADGLTVLSGGGGKMVTTFEILSGTESAKHCGGCTE